MRQLLTSAVLSVVAGLPAFAQPAEPRLEFEVASVKPWSPPAAGGGRGLFFGMRGGPGSPDPGQLTLSGLPLKLILANAYDVQRYQISGPDWLDSERFDIVAKVPAGASKEQSRIMLQNLLADRFSLKLHHETKDGQILELVVDKNGPKLKPSAAQADSAAPKPEGPPPPPGSLKLDKDGFPQLDRPGLFMMLAAGSTGPRARMVAKEQTFEEVSKLLSNQLNRPVVDKTGLTAKYDFTLEYTFDPGAGGLLGGLPPPPGGGLAGAGPGPGPAPGGAAGPVTAPLDGQSADSAPTVFAAVQSQLGLKLEPKKAPLDLLVIDHAEKTPTEN